MKKKKLNFCQRRTGVRRQHSSWLENSFICLTLNYFGHNDSVNQTKQNNKKMAKVIFLRDLRWSVSVCILQIQSINGDLCVSFLICFKETQIAWFLVTVTAKLSILLYKSDSGKPQSIIKFHSIFQQQKNTSIYVDLRLYKKLTEWWTLLIVVTYFRSQSISQTIVLCSAVIDNIIDNDIFMFETIRNFFILLSLHSIYSFASCCLTNWDNSRNGAPLCKFLLKI